MSTPTLYIIPTPIADESSLHLPPETIEVIHRIQSYIVEREKTARQAIKRTKPPYQQSSLQLFELDKHDPQGNRQIIDEALSYRKDIGLMSEAGCPAIADPGSEVVRAARKLAYRIKPLVGPSSIFLALMASGLNGQSFQFHGYLPIKKDALKKKLKSMEKAVEKNQTSQIFIEAPYRNVKMIQSISSIVAHSRELCVAMNLSSPTEDIVTMTIKNWKQKKDLEVYHKQPCIFILG